jgi:hypothetical protein
MGVQNASIVVGSTPSFSGGTAATFTPDGQQVNNGIHISDASQADFRIRRNMSVRTTPPALNSNGVWKGGKREITAVCPKVLADGTQIFPNIRIIVSDHPEMTQAEVDALWDMGGQVCYDADFQAYRRTGSLA